MAGDLRLGPASSDAEIRACFAVMRQLRPHLASDAELLERVRRQEAQGYRLTAIWRGDRAVACAGWRLTENLIRGRFLYVDDLVTDENERSTGLGDRLFDALVAEARANDCRAFVLDSGVANGAGHRFYFRKRMIASALHFTLLLE